MRAPRAVSWSALGAVILVGITVAGVIGWQVRVKAVDRQIQRKEAAIKKLFLKGDVPPNDEVMAYLEQRAQALQTHYEAALKMVVPVVSEESRRVEPQLHFQDRFHQVERTLGRLAAAREISVPLLLGFPKELPPADTVPRFLTQVGIIEEVAAMILAVEGIAELESFKVDDPQTVPPMGLLKRSFLTRLPVRIRFACSLDDLTTVLGTLAKAKPILDFQVVRITAPQPAPPAAEVTGEGDTAQAAPAVVEGPRTLRVELVLSRYLVTEAPEEEVEEDADQRRTPRRRRRRSKRTQDTKS